MRSNSSTFNMIINSSRDSLLQECRQKMWNWDELGLLSWREADPLMVGEAFHAGIAHIYTSGGNTKESVELSEHTFRLRLKDQKLLPEEIQLVEHNIKLVRKSVEKYAFHWKDEPLQVLMPEVRFRVELPNSHHHCFFCHRLLHLEDPYRPEWGWQGDVGLSACSDTKCWQPHFFTGRTDAVVNWRNMIWILESKSTAPSFRQALLDRFYLDTQGRSYTYGVWKSTGVRPRGVILNILIKPNKNASDPYNVGFEREAYLYDDQSLVEIESHLRMVAQQYEEAISKKIIYQNTRSCTNYNRRCYYMNLCKNHHQVEEGEFRQRPLDYVNLQYYEILGLPKPEGEPDAIPSEMSDAG